MNRGPDIDAIIYRLKEEEGFEASAYRDHLGYLTIGFGTCVDHRKNCGITEREATLLLENRVTLILRELDRRIPWWRGLKPGAADALAQLAYQIGVAGALNFKRMIKAAEKADLQTMAAELMDSKLAREQTPARAERLRALILS